MRLDDELALAFLNFCVIYCFPLTLGSLATKLGVFLGLEFGLEFMTLGG